MISFRLIFISLIFSILFSEDTFTSWIKEHSFSDSTVFIDLACVIETKMKLNNFENINRKHIHLQMDYLEQFNLEMDGVYLVSNGDEWQRYDSRTNQLFIQNPDSSFLNTINEWKQYFLSDNFHTQKEDDLYVIQNENMLHKITFKFDPTNNKIEYITVISPDSEIKIDEINIFSKSEIPERFNSLNIENPFIFDLRE